MKFGYSKEIITPSHEVNLGGYTKDRFTTSKYDDLYAKVILIENNDEIFGFVSFDLVAVDHILIEKIKTVLLKYKRKFQVEVSHLS